MTTRALKRDLAALEKDMRSPGRRRLKRPEPRRRRMRTVTIDRRSGRGVKPVSTSPRRNVNDGLRLLYYRKPASNCDDAQTKSPPRGRDGLS